jgi:hypothetical protein
MDALTAGSTAKRRSRTRFFWDCGEQLREPVQKTGNTNEKSCQYVSAEGTLWFLS